MEQTERGRGKQRVARLPDYPPKPCADCAAPFSPYKIDQRFCTPLCQHRFFGKAAYLRRHNNTLPATQGTCGVCHATFTRADRHDWRRRYCSGACSKEARRRSRKRFHDRNPDYRGQTDKAYNGGKFSSTVTKFFRRCPDVPRQCRVCGEARVVDIHHKTHRNGEPVRALNTQREHVWVLCPNHHAMLHRGIASPSDLRLS